MEGWVSIYRKELDNPIICKDSQYFSVWNYLLLHATHKKINMIFNGKKIELMPGQLITGRKTIHQQFKDISESKIQRILKLFENEQQIEQQTSTHNRLITIVNWNRYQQIEQQIEQQVNNNRTTNEQQVNTNNNDNNNNNLYLYLLNKYKEKIQGKNFNEKIRLINICKQEEDYINISAEEQNKLFNELILIK